MEKIGVLSWRNRHVPVTQLYTMVLQFTVVLQRISIRCLTTLIALLCQSFRLARWLYRPLHIRTSKHWDQPVTHCLMRSRSNCRQLQQYYEKLSLCEQLKVMTCADLTCVCDSCRCTALIMHIYPSIIPSGSHPCISAWM